MERFQAHRPGTTKTVALSFPVWSVGVGVVLNVGANFSSSLSRTRMARTVEMKSSVSRLVILAVLSQKVGPNDQNGHNE